MEGKREEVWHEGRGGVGRPVHGRGGVSDAFPGRQGTDQLGLIRRGEVEVEVGWEGHVRGAECSSLYAFSSKAASVTKVSSPLLQNEHYTYRACRPKHTNQRKP